MRKQYPKNGSENSVLSHQKVNLSSLRNIIHKYSDYSGEKVLILLEHENQVRHCLQWIDEVKGEKQIIALSPFATYELDKHKIKYKIPEDYYQPEELYRLGIENYQKAEDLSSLVDKVIHSFCPILANLGVRPAWFSIRDLKALLDSTTIRLFQLLRIIETGEPDVIYVYDGQHIPLGNYEQATPYLWFDNRESIYAHLLGLDGWKRTVIVLPCVAKSENPFIQKDFGNALAAVGKKIAGWLLKKNPDLFEILWAIRKKDWEGFKKKLKHVRSLNSKIPVLLLGAGYNWSDCRDELSHAGIGPIFRILDSPEHWLTRSLPHGIEFGALESAWKQLESDKEFREFFCWENIDFFPVVEKRLRFLVKDLTLACLKAYKESASIIERMNAKALLASILANCTQQSVAKAANNAGIPVILWQHGIYALFHQPSAKYFEFLGSDIEFVFGEGVIEQYKQEAKRFDTHLVSVGSSSLEKLNLKQRNKFAILRENIGIDSNRKVVLYVTSYFHQNHLYISYFPPFSDNLFWKTQRGIIEVLGSYDEYMTVVKLFPNLIHREPPLRGYAKEKGYENCRFIRNKYSFVDLLPLADIIVMDITGTQCLLQTLTTTKPIFVYGGHSPVDEKAQKLLKRRAHYYEQLGDFINALSECLREESIGSVDLNDRKFLETYGTYRSDGKAGERAAQMVKEIIRAPVK